MGYTTPRTWVAAETVDENHLNEQIRDNFNAALPVGVAWQTWTPTLTNITEGSGTVVARYTRIGDLVVGFFTFTLGAGSAIGTGPTFSLPVTADTSMPSIALGPSRFAETGVAAYGGVTQLGSSTTASPRAFRADGTYATNAALTSAVPFTWASGDVLQSMFQYEAA